MSSASVIFDILARDRASDKFDKIGKSADGTKSKMAALAKFGRVGLGVLAVGAAAAAGGIGLMVKAAIDDQQSQSKLAQTLKNTTGATKDQIASVEDWITAQGKAFGVADDDLRPALDKLAVATGSVGKSQQLASLAMNVSAGTGKSLGAVSAALGKAYNGNVGALGRLGIATKDAHGKTKTFGVIQAELAKKFKGQAGVAADTFAGRVKRLKLALSEAGESIGYKLLPIAERLAGWFVNKGLPAIDGFVSFISTRFGPVFAEIGTIVNTKILPAVSTFIGQMKSGEGAGGKVADVLQQVGGALGTVFTWISNNKSTVATFVGVLGTVVAISKIWTGVQLALNFALTANPIGLIVVGLAALAAGLVYAYKHSEKFRAIVDGAFRVVKGSASAVVGFFTNKVPAAFSAVTGAAHSVLGWVKGHWPILVGILTGPFGIAVALIATHWSQIVQGARSAIGKVTRFFAGLPGKITGAVGDLGGLLLGAGKAVVQGLIDGIQSGVHRVTSAAQAIANAIPGPVKKILGIHSPSKVFHGIGQNVMDGLLNGLKNRWTPVKDFLQKITDKVQATGDNLKSLLDARNQFASGFQSFASSIFGRDPGQDANGNALPETVAGIKAFAAAQSSQANQLARNVQRLVGLGLSKSLITQLQGQGSSGIAQINTLAGSASRGDIAYLNAQDRATSASLGAAGMSAANALYGADIAKAKRDADTAKAIAAELAKELKPYMDRNLSVTLRGSDLLIAIEREKKRQHGGH